MNLFRSSKTSTSCRFERSTTASNSRTSSSSCEDGYVDKDGQVHKALRMRLPTGADESAVAPQMRQNASLGKNALLSRCLKSLGDLPKHRLEAIGPKILADLTMTDRRLIDKALNQAAPGVDLIA